MAASVPAQSQLLLFAGASPAPALLQGENPDDYEALRKRIVEVVEPKDALEQIWVGDIVELTFEIHRLRHMKLRIIEGAKAEALHKLLTPICGYRHSETFSQENHAKPIKQLDAVLKHWGLSHDHVMAQAMAVRIKEVEKVNTMIMLAEARRNKALHEIDRHRDVLAARLRAAAAIEDADFREVELARGLAEGSDDDACEE